MKFSEKKTYEIHELEKDKTYESNGLLYALNSDGKLIRQRKDEKHWRESILEHNYVVGMRFTEVIEYHNFTEALAHMEDQKFVVLKNQRFSMVGGSFFSGEHNCTRVELSYGQIKSEKWEWL